MTNGSKNQVWWVRGLTLAALVLMIAAYFTPIWWVSLTAPNYPKEAFPDGIRIHFHFNGVFNGCKAPALKKGSHASEVLQADLGDDLTEREGMKAGESAETGLNCVHEMNTINHYVGMYPIDTGAPVEVPMSKFFFGFFAVLLLGFMATQRKQQLMILGAGFAAVTAWMVTDQIVLGHLNAFADHYYHEASTFFNQPEVLERWTANLKLATKAAMAGLVVAMLIIMLGVWKIRQFSLLLALVPALLPVFFVLDYAGWLWFFGHNMHPWGAFTVKPFMPTVFGEGKVAQFSTYSYPYYGYAILLAASAALLPAILIRRKMMREEQG
ncbi:hypothetical protein [Sulfuricella sp. T08]|uniref:hypothetical protein n=1 Tax=Sulfuricella sp. T08 TaxID=1632857 RepID=UPI000750FA1C|nr:hypothetical protein [Sulfuricella sp. T08]